MTQPVQMLLAEGVRHHRAGALDAAEQLYRQVLTIDPRHADGLHLLGLVEHQRGRFEVSIDTIRQAIALDPGQAVYHANLGTVLREHDCLQEAVSAYRLALRLRPDDAETSNNLGNALHGLGQSDDAVEAYRACLRFQPGHAAAHYNLGNTLRDLGRPREAVDSFRLALLHKPDDAGTLNNLGNALQDLGLLEAAAAAYRRAVAHRPDYPVALNNLGYVLRQQRRFDAAAACFREALARQPDFAAASLNLAMLLLARGDFSAGWAAFEWRWQMPDMASVRRDLAQPRWRGEPGQGRTLLIHAEQGFGDTLQFCRFAAPAAARGLRVIMQVPRPLLRLLHDLPGVDALVADDQPTPPFDLHCPMLSLPLALGTTLPTLPATVPYLKADRSAVALWGTRLDAAARKTPRIGLVRIGVVWAGSARQHLRSAAAVDRRRSLPPDYLMPLFALPGLQFVSLQKGGPPAPAEYPMVDLMREVDDFADTAALISHLDLVISVDTAVAHLAAALGKPVWVLDRFDHCWRWLAGRRDSPWYPTLRLYRQPRSGDWESVLAEVVADLHAFSMGQSEPASGY